MVKDLVHTFGIIDAAAFDVFCFALNPAGPGHGWEATGWPDTGGPGPHRVWRQRVAQHCDLVSAARTRRTASRDASTDGPRPTLPLAKDGEQGRVWGSARAFPPPCHNSVTARMLHGATGRPRAYPRALRGALTLHRDTGTGPDSDRDTPGRSGGPAQVDVSAMQDPEAAATINHRRIHILFNIQVSRRRVDPPQTRHSPPRHPRPLCFGTLPPTVHV